MSRSRFFKPIVKGTQGACYALGAAVVIPPTVAVGLTDVVVKGANIVLPLSGFEKRLDRITSFRISSIDFFAQKTIHKMQRAVGNDQHEDKSKQSFELHNMTFKKRY